MPMDGIMLGFLLRDMQEKLLLGRVDKVNQPESDTVILTVRGAGKNYKLLLCASPSYARAHLTDESFVNPPDAPMFCMLMRKNLMGGRIVALEQLAGDRVLHLAVDSRDEMGDSGVKHLYLEMMGRHSNLTLVQEGRIVDAIRHVSFDMSRVRQALPGLPFVMPPTQDKLNPWQTDEAALAARLSGETGRLDKALSSQLTGVGAVTARELAARATGRADARLENVDALEVSARLAVFLAKLPALAEPRLLLDEREVPSDVLPFPFVSLPGDRQRPCASFGGAMDAYYTGRDKRERIHQKSATLRHLIRTALERDEKKLALQEEELSASARMEEYRVAGELLTAQAYLVPRGVTQVELPNFYDPEGGTMSIGLDVALTPAQNAQKYFKKYRKARSAQLLAAEQKEKTLAEIRVLEQAMEDVSTCEREDELGDVRRFLEENGVLRAAPQRRGAKRPPVSRPHHYLSVDGLHIYVGKNSVQNERLTHDARGDDLWLHAKDMPASHVIVCCPEGQACPEGTLRQAAQLAAYFSKARGVSVPVDYTLRKYVKKPGGTPAGFVIYTHQKTAVVDADEGDVRRIQEIDGVSKN